MILLFWLLILSTGLAEASPPGLLDAGLVCLSAEAGNPSRISLKDPHAGTEFTVEEPLCIQLVTAAGATVWLSGHYSSVIRAGSGLVCAGRIQTPAGTVFEFADTFQPGPAKTSVLLTRRLIVATAAKEDTGFLSRFAVSASVPRPLRDHEFFIPGLWYLDNAHLPAYALAADLSDEYFIMREDRMPLPLVMMRDKQDGTTLTLIHSAPDGSTCLADYSPGRVVDERVQVASLGVFCQTNPALAFYYPATEGERSYLSPGRRRGDQPASKNWVERFHPVQPGVRHTYEILIDVTEQADFAKAMRHAWRTAYQRILPSLALVDVPASYEASIKLISDWSRVTRGAPGLPFRLRLPKGELEDEEKINYQMGFVGQQLPLAYHLLRYGLRHTNELIVHKGEAMVDFWATNSLTPAGLPRTWFNTWPEPHWRRYNTFLRVATDGMEGALRACDVMTAYGREKPQWLAFCASFGNWLVEHQSSDGAWSREYRFDSTPADTSKHNTCHAVPFLVDLFKLTQDRRYLKAAMRAGDWCWTNTHRAFCYVGGTADNPNVIDKEAGFLALGAFEALHDATDEKRWLDAAAQAADFTETWAYCWNVPIPPEDARATYPKGATTAGFSLIAGGHSGADLFLAGAPFLFYRLYLQTGDTHYADMARIFLYDPRQSMDIDGSRGYGHTGLCTEALSLAPPRGRGVNTWLPWLTYSMIEPLVRLQDAYGIMDVPVATGAKFDELAAKDSRFAKTRGLLSAEGGLQGSER